MSFLSRLVPGRSKMKDDTPMSRVIDALSVDSAPVVQAAPQDVDSLFSALHEHGDAGYLDWRDDPETARQNLKHVADRRKPGASWRRLPDVPDEWDAMDEDELALPKSLDLVATYLNEPWYLVLLPIDADGYGVGLVGVDDAEQLARDSDEAGLGLQIFRGGADVDGTYAIVRERLARTGEQ